VSSMVATLALADLAGIKRANADCSESKREVRMAWPTRYLAVHNPPKTRDHMIQASRPPLSQACEATSLQTFAAESHAA
jgi:hypothetical protein